MLPKECPAHFVQFLQERHAGHPSILVAFLLPPVHDVILLIRFAFVNGFSSQTLYEPYIFQFFNVFYASAPIVVYALVDKEHESDVLVKHPSLYEPGMKDQHFNIRVYWYWIANAWFQSLAIALFS